MARSCLPTVLGVVLLALTLTIGQAADTCQAYGECCFSTDISCGPASCKCDQSCDIRGDCCADYTSYCEACGDSSMMRLGDKCLQYNGLQEKLFYTAKYECKQIGRTGSIVMFETEQEWVDFANSKFLKYIGGDDPSFYYWINCRIHKDKWYWLVRRSKFPGKPVTFNEFYDQPPYTFSIRYVGVGVGNSRWMKSKGNVAASIICQKKPEKV